MAHGVYLGVDLGTSSLKVVACRADGAVAAEHEVVLGVDTPRPGWAEADPDAWVAAARAALDAVLARLPGLDVLGVGITGQMHGTVLLDEHGRPTRPAVLWPDTRAVDQAARWSELPPTVQARLGGPFSPGMTGPVLGWLGAHEDLSGVRRVLLPKDWLRHVLCATPLDEAVTDRSDASATLLWDVAADTWSDDVVAALGLDPALLPPAVSSDTVVGEWRGAPVVAGGGDTPVSLVALERAVGGWRPGDLVVNLGTGAQVIVPDAAPPDGEGPPGWHVYDDAHRGRYAMVAVLNGGLALSWARDRLGLDWPAFAALCSAEPAGAGGVLFSPFVTRERGAMRPATEGAPGWLGGDGAPDARLARAAAEAQVFLVRRARALLGVTGSRVLLIGGGGRDPWVQQLVADALGLPVERIEIRSAAGLGAAALAAGPDWTVPVGVTSTAPRPAPALDEAYGRWLAACYPDA